MKKLDSFEFTLVLNGVDDQTENLEDRLFEAGCDDALINFRNGTVYLDFIREADSIENAVISAIMNIETSDLHAKVISILPDDLVSEADIAKRLNKSRQVVSLWFKRARRQEFPFPNPVSRLADKSPMWRWYDVAKWLYHQQLIKDKKVVDFAMFIENINAVIDARDSEVYQYRNHILKKLKQNQIDNIGVNR